VKVVLFGATGMVGQGVCASFYSTLTWRESSRSSATPASFSIVPHRTRHASFESQAARDCGTESKLLLLG
jgi:hypothetical protein